MRFFKTLFNIAKLPVAIVVDAFVAIPESASLITPFERTRKLCDKIDDSISEKL